MPCSATQGTLQVHVKHHRAAKHPVESLPVHALASTHRTCELCFRRWMHACRTPHQLLRHEPQRSCVQPNTRTQPQGHLAPHESASSADFLDGPVARQERAHHHNCHNDDTTVTTTTKSRQFVVLLVHRPCDCECTTVQAGNKRRARPGPLCCTLNPATVHQQLR